jgi:hypothetical protein
MPEARSAGIALTMDALIRRFGAGFRYVGHALDRHLVCARFGAKDAAVQNHILRSDKSRFAD